MDQHTQHAAALPAQPHAVRGLQGCSNPQPQRKQMLPQSQKRMFLVVCRPLVQVQVRWCWQAHLHRLRCLNSSKGESGQGRGPRLVPDLKLARSSDA